MTDNVVYTKLENGIYRFYWHNVEIPTIHEYVKIFKRLHDIIPENATVHLLHDYRDTGTPPFNTVATIMKNFKMRADITLRVAHLYSDGIYPTIMQNASIVARFDANRKFFRANEEQQAIDWLLDY